MSFESAQRHFPPNMPLENRKIIRCSIPGEWYEKHIGEVFTVHNFGSFGMWDTKKRWIYYVDVSEPL